MIYWLTFLPNASYIIHMGEPARWFVSFHSWYCSESNNRWILSSQWAERLAYSPPNRLDLHKKGFSWEFQGLPSCLTRRLTWSSYSDRPLKTFSNSFPGSRTTKIFGQDKEQHCWMGHHRSTCPQNSKKKLQPVRPCDIFENDLLLCGPSPGARQRCSRSHAWSRCPRCREPRKWTIAGGGTIAAAGTAVAAGDTCSMQLVGHLQLLGQVPLALKNEIQVSLEPLDNVSQSSYLIWHFVWALSFMFQRWGAKTIIKKDATLAGSVKTLYHTPKLSAASVQNLFTGSMPQYSQEHHLKKLRTKEAHLHDLNSTKGKPRIRNNHRMIIPS